MTEFNQQVSAITKRVVEHGETIRVTNRGRVVLRLVPEPAGAEQAVESLIDGGLATAPTSPHHPRAGREPVPLSRSLDELLEETRADGAL